MLKIALDNVYMDKILGGVVQVDDFTRNLLKINKIIQKEGPSQNVIACINRSDYMLDKNSRNSTNLLKIRQVEVNAIASGMSSHSCNTMAMHNYLMAKYKVVKPNNDYMPENKSLQFVSQGVIESFDSYGKPDAHILLIIEERSINFSDQFAIELTVSKIRPDIQFIRRSFNSLPDIIKLGPNKELILEGNKEIGLVYFRCGYDPTNYNFEGAWDVRLLLERSRAIKNPSINFHISGAKKFQQVLNSREQLERFLNPYEADRLAKTFCKFWSIEDSTPDGNEGFQIGLNPSKKLVLKPQREGGGHNVYGKDVRPFLQRLPHAEERSQYILMEYIDSPLEKNWLLLCDDEPFKEPSKLDSYDRLVSELGIYGSIIADGSNIKSNKYAGYLVRSKKYGVNEGGVQSGCAGLSSLILVDDTRDDFNSSVYYD